MYSDEDIFEELNYGNNFEALANRRKKEKRYIAIACGLILILSLAAIFFL